MKIRQLLKITSRTSSVTNGFVQAIIPSIEPTHSEIVEALQILGMTVDARSCIYCGMAATDWDHLRPLVQHKRPTGYIHEIRNLVPSCGPCNQSKSGANWEAWMNSDARGSPRSKGVSDLEQRIDRLRRFVEWGNVKPLPLSELAGVEQWNAHWANLHTILQKMQEAQQHAVLVREAIHRALKVRK